MNKNLSIKPGTKVTVMGLGRFGGQIAAIRHCAQAGAEVLVSDHSSSEILADSLTRLSDCPNVSFRFGSHSIEDFVTADLVIVSPAVKPNHICLLEAEKNGVPVQTEIELFLENCPGKIIAVSGTVGKSTTASMIAHLFNRLDMNVYLGGNIGNSLLPVVNQIADDDWIILELSSFQLHWLSRGRIVFDIALLTNYSPHHLDWHEHEQHYLQCKQALFRDQRETEFAVLPIDLKMNEKWTSKAETVYFEVDSSTKFPANWPAHFKQNASAAAAVLKKVCELKGIEIHKQELISLLADFRGLPHRLELVAQKNGRRFINDSKSTGPQSTVAAIRDLQQPTWLILGGVPITDDLDELVVSIKSASFLKGIAFLGPGGESISRYVSPFIAHLKNEIRCSHFQTLQPAVEWCWDNSKQNETILLSPACPSYDEFRNYEQRGEMFKQYVDELK